MPSFLKGNLLLAIILLYLFVLRTRVPQRSRFRLLEKAYRFHGTLISFRDRSVIISAMFISLAFTMIIVIVIAIALLAYDHPVSFLLLCFLVPLVSVVEVVPISLNSLGVREGLGVYLFSLFGIPLGVGLAVFLVTRVITLLCSLTGGIGYLTGTQQRERS